VLPEEEAKSTKADATSAVFRDLAAAIERCFDAISIADVCSRGDSLGLRRRGAREPTNYVI
jgi:hypothetical protein